MLSNMTSSWENNSPPSPSSPLLPHLLPPSSSFLTFLTQIHPLSLSSPFTESSHLSQHPSSHLPLLQSSPPPSLLESIPSSISRAREPPFPWSGREASASWRSRRRSRGCGEEQDEEEKGVGDDESCGGSLSRWTGGRVGTSWDCCWWESACE